MTYGAIALAECAAATELLEALFQKAQLALMIVEEAVAERPPDELGRFLGADKYRRLQEIISFRHMLFRYAIDLDYPGLIEEAKGLVESEQSTSIWATRYLISQRPRNPDVDEFLRRKSRDPQSRLFRDPGLASEAEQRERATQRAVRSLRENLDAFRLELRHRYVGEKQTRGYRSLILSVPAFKEELPENYLRARLSRAQAERIVEHLTQTSFLYRGTFNREKALVVPKGHSYFLSAGTTPSDIYYEYIPFGPALVERLKALQEVAGGEAARALGKLIEEVEAAGIEADE